MRIAGVLFYSFLPLLGSHFQNVDRTHPFAIGFLAYPNYIAAVHRAVVLKLPHLESLLGDQCTLTGDDCNAPASGVSRKTFFG